MGVDQKRPLVGFALVAVLCAVLMALSVGRGWSVDLFHPGKPIAAPDSLAPVDRERPAHADEPGVVVIPAELAPQPLAGGKGAAVSRSDGRDREGPETAAEETEGLAGDDSTTQTQAETQAETQPEAGTRAARQAEKAAAKLERLAEQAAEQAAENAAEKAAEKAERLAEAAAEPAAQTAAQAGHQSEQAAAVAAAQAAHLADQLLRQAARSAG